MLTRYGILYNANYRLGYNMNIILYGFIFINHSPINIMVSFLMALKSHKFSTQFSPKKVFTTNIYTCKFCSHNLELNKL